MPRSIAGRPRIDPWMWSPGFAVTVLPQGTVSAAYSYTLAATGGTAPYTWAVSSGALPAGLSLATTGVVSGTPTTAGTNTPENPGSMIRSSLDGDLLVLLDPNRLAETRTNA